MNLKNQKRLASKVAKTGLKRVKVDPEARDDIKDAITKADIRGLIAEGSIKIVNKRGVSRHRARKRHIKKKKGRRKGHGKRKGRATARLPRKRAWIIKIRAQRKILQDLKKRARITPHDYRKTYALANSGFFRNQNHLKTYLSQNNLLVEKKVKK